MPTKRSIAERAASAGAFTARGIAKVAKEWKRQATGEALADAKSNAASQEWKNETKAVASRTAVYRASGYNTKGKKINGRNRF